MLTLILAFASLIFMAHILYEGAHFGSKEKLKEYPKSETDDFAKMIEIKDSVKRTFMKSFAKRIIVSQIFIAIISRISKTLTKGS